MNLSQWLAAEKGRASAMAAHFNVSPAAVSQWKSNGVPLANMKAVRDYTGGQVTLEEMVPDKKLGAGEPACEGAIVMGETRRPLVCGVQGACQQRRLVVEGTLCLNTALPMIAHPGGVLRCEMCDEFSAAAQVEGDVEGVRDAA